MTRTRLRCRRRKTKSILRSTAIPTAAEVEEVVVEAATGAAVVVEVATEAELTSVVRDDD